MLEALVAESDGAATGKATPVGRTLCRYRARTSRLPRRWSDRASSVGMVGYSCNDEGSRGFKTKWIYVDVHPLGLEFTGALVVATVSDHAYLGGTTGLSAEEDFDSRGRHGCSSTLPSLADIETPSPTGVPAPVAAPLLLANEWLLPLISYGKVV